MGYTVVGKGGVGHVLWSGMCVVVEARGRWRGGERERAVSHTEHSNLMYPCTWQKIFLYYMRNIEVGTFRGRRGMVE